MLYEKVKACVLIGLSPQWTWNQIMMMHATIFLIFVGFQQPTLCWFWGISLGNYTNDDYGYLQIDKLLILHISGEVLTLDHHMVKILTWILQPCNDREKSYYREIWNYPLWFPSSILFIWLYHRDRCNPNEYLDTLLWYGQYMDHVLIDWL